MAFGGVFTIQGEEEFSSVSCGRVLISLTPHLIHSVSISLSLTSSLSVLLSWFCSKTSFLLTIQPEQVEEFTKALPKSIFVA